MRHFLSLVLHAHLPFVRHPEHERFLEENWLFEAVIETYLPLLQVLRGWQRERLPARLALTLSPTLCAMLRDPLLRQRCQRHLAGLIELAEKEVLRTTWEGPVNELARFYSERLRGLNGLYSEIDGDLVEAFRKLQESGLLEIATSAATHAILPLMAGHAPSVRAQLQVAREDYRECFGREPRGLWLPECAYSDSLEPMLAEAGFQWFILDSHGLLHASPKPVYAVFAPILTPGGLAAFARDHESARQVWSRDEGYPGDPRYRDFYRDIGFDLDLDYVRPYLAAPDQRGFTGFKYHRITGRTGPKELYARAAALEAVSAHANHFVEARLAQLARLEAIMDRPATVVCPYDAELFGHWWFEGIDFLDAVVRKSCQCSSRFCLASPADCLREQPVIQAAAPAASSWGEGGHWQVWLNATNEWIFPHLQVAQERMTELVRHRSDPGPLHRRALQQAGRELLLAQASDWPFILRTGTSPDYARRRVKEHLLRFTRLYEQISSGGVDLEFLEETESADNLFPSLDFRHWG